MIEVREARAEDERGILELYQRVFSRVLAVEHWRWKREMSFVAVDGARVVAHYGSSPRRFWLRDAGTVVPGASAADAMTDPEYRRRGLLTQVTLFAQSVLRERGIAFELGIPASTWGSRADALGWEKLFEMRALIRPLLLPPIARALKAQYVLEPGEDFDRLWEACKNDIAIAQVRDRAWVAWRYIASPVLKYRVLSTGDAWVAVRSDGDIGYIVDELGEPRALKIAIAAAVEVLRAKGAKKAQVFLATGTPRARLYQRLGFLYPRDRLYASCHPYANGLPSEQLRDPRATLIRGGDFDFA